METVASYVIILRDVFPNIPGHLVSASFISIPAALIMSKLVMPETDVPETLGKTVEPDVEEKDSVFAVIIDGSENGLKMIFGIGAILISAVGIVAVLNMFVRLIHPAISLENGLAYLFYPFALLMGVPAGESFEVANLLGLRIIATEFAAYTALSEMLPGGTTTPRSETILDHLKGHVPL